MVTPLLEWLRAKETSRFWWVFLTPLASAGGNSSCVPSPNSLTSQRKSRSVLHGAFNQWLLVLTIPFT